MTKTKKRVPSSVEESLERLRSGVAALLDDDSRSFETLEEELSSLINDVGRASSGALLKKKSREPKES